MSVPSLRYSRPVALAVIGDIHGNATGLRALLRRLNDRISHNTPVVFLGDYIDGGPSTRQVIELMIRFCDSRPGPSVFLRGNHEEWLLRSLEDHSKHSWILSMRGLSTIGSYSPELEAEFRELMQKTGPALISDGLELPYDRVLAAMPESHVQFFSKLEIAYEDGLCICTHAGLSCEYRGLSYETERDVVWGNESFPECYDGAKTVVYGHFSKRARLAGGVVVPLLKNNTICLDTSKHNVVSAVMLPQRRLLQSKGESREDK